MIDELEFAAELELTDLLGEAAAHTCELVGRSALAWVRRPENLAGLTGAVLLPPLVFRGRRPPLIPWLIVSLAGDQMFRMGYRAQRNLQAIADAAALDHPPQLLFHHGADCPGHTTGKPGKSCLEDCADTTG